MPVWSQLFRPLPRIPTQGSKIWLSPETASPRRNGGSLGPKIVRGASLLTPFGETYSGDQGTLQRWCAVLTKGL